MPSVSEEMVCPGCGASVSITDKICAYCGRKLTITSVKNSRKQSFAQAEKFLHAYKETKSGSEDDSSVQASLGFVEFDQGHFAAASEAFSKATTNGSTDSDVIFYKAIAQFRTKKPFSIKLNEAKEILKSIDDAIEREQLPQYIFAKSLLIETLFEKRFVRYKENSKQLLADSKAAGLTDTDVAKIHEILNIK